MLEKWLESASIEGVVTKQKTIMKTNIVDDYSEWAIPPKLVQSKKSKTISTEIMAMIKTTESAYSLFLKEKEYCTKNSIYVSAKNTIMEYTNKIGFLTQTYV